MTVGSLRSRRRATKPLRFVIDRVSASHRLGDEPSPCDGAVRGTHVYRDQIRLKYKPADWEAQGRNHRETKSMAYRDLDRECWYIEIATLDDLLRFARKYGDLIIGRPFMATTGQRITIYDGYIE